MKRALTLISSFALALGAPVSAQESQTGANNAPNHAQADTQGLGLEDLVGVFDGLFSAEELTPEQEARLPAATKLVAQMMPEGFYAEMMSEMMGSTMAPLMSMISGEVGADIVLAERINGGSGAFAMSAEQKVELASILDPGFAKRGQVMEEIMGDAMMKAAQAIEPGFRKGMANAYAVRFDKAQLADIAAFFATPTGSIYATENMKLMADPQVMSASMSAMPAIMQQMGDLQTRLQTAMEAVPAQKSLEELTSQERARVSELIGVDEAGLPQFIYPPSGETDSATIEPAAF